MQRRRHIRHVVSKVLRFGEATLGLRLRGTIAIMVHTDDLKSRDGQRRFFRWIKSSVLTRIPPE